MLPFDLEVKIPSYSALSFINIALFGIINRMLLAVFPYVSEIANLEIDLMVSYATHRLFL